MRNRKFFSFLSAAALLALMVAAVPALAEENTLPVSYDLRKLEGVPSEIRDQDPYGTCWAFSAMAAIESNYMVHVSNDENFAVSELGGATGKNPDTSEMHLAWFVFKAPKGKEYTAFSVTSGDKLLSMEDLEKNPEKVLTGASWERAAAFLSRGYGFGPIPESSLLYSTDTVKTLSAKTDAKPADYMPTVLRLTDVWIVDYPSSSDKDFEKTRQDAIADAKRLIFQNGALSLSYTDADDSRDNINKTYFCSEANLAKVPEKNKAGHSVAVVGWNDNFSMVSFDVPGRSLPNIDGAWLIRNSWGKPEDHDNGYFWMSYEQNVEFALYRVERANAEKKCYLWDDLGWCSEWGEKDSDAYALNVFKAGSEGVTLKDIGFYTTERDVSVDIYVNTNYGTTKPTEATVDLGEKIDSIRFDYKGYHTVSLDEYLGKSISVSPNYYFSVAIRIGKEAELDQPIAVETAVRGISDYARVGDGESFFSLNGKNWTDGVKMTNGKEYTPMNACVKVFVTGGVQPEEAWSIDGKKVSDRPDDTVNADALEAANTPDKGAALTGRSLSLFLLSNDEAALPGGTDAKLTFLFLGSDKDYNNYYEDEDEDDAHYYGYMQKPDAAYLRKVYPTGYEPQSYVNDDGVLYPAYTGDAFKITVDGEGHLLVDAGELPTAAADGRTIPDGYYDVYYEADGVVGTLPLIQVTAASGGGGSSSGCDTLWGAGAGLLHLAGLGVVCLGAARLRKRK